MTSQPHRWVSALTLPSLLAIGMTWFMPAQHARSVQSPAESAVSDQLIEAWAAESRRIKVIGQAVRASCSVFAANGEGGGSGVVISADGYALTNYHVVKPCGKYMHCSMPDGELYDAVLVGIDPTGDVAMIKLLGRDDFPTATLGNSDQLRVGENCFAVGNPFLLATNFQPTVTWGIVSGIHRYQYPAGTLLEYTDCIQTDAAINPGNSGGPLFNARGELIGINGRGSFEKRGRVNVGVGYAISINQIKLFLDHLGSGRIVDHATLGATVSSDNRGRVTVDNILRSSDAYRRGLRYGDEIVSFASRTITTANEFKNVLGIYPKGWKVPLEYRRDGQDYSTVVRLSGLHSTQQLVDLVEGPDTEPRGPQPPGRQPPGPDDQPPPKRPRENPRKHPSPLRPPSGKIEIPDVAQQLIEEKTGFANYYFNRLRTKQIWDRFLSHGIPFAPHEKKWHMKGRLGDGTAVSILLSENGSGIQWGDQTAVLDLDIDLSEQLVPGGSGGLLPAMHLWQRMLTHGPTAYGDVYYLGGLPWVDSNTTADVLVATFDVIETHFIFDRTDSRMIGLEMWSDSYRDPCVVQLADYREIQGREFPGVITVQHGDTFGWVLYVDEISAANIDR